MQSIKIYVFQSVSITVEVYWSAAKQFAVRRD